MSVINASEPVLPPREHAARRAATLTSRVTDIPRAERLLATASETLAASESQPVAERLRALCVALDGLVPFPARGHTLTRFRLLAAIAGSDLSLARLFEGHADALAIHEELDAPFPHEPSSTWGVWAAEARERVALSIATDGTARLHGVKHWCSGAPLLTHALVTAWRGDAGPFLVAISLDQAGVTPRRGRWSAVGMADSESVDVELAQAHGIVVGDVGRYLSRSGFWHGAMGVAACWFGGAVAVGEIARRYMPDNADPIRAAHLGAIDVALAQAGDVLRAVAAWTDRNPDTDARVPALRARAAVDSAAQAVLHHAGRLLGASAYCLNPTFARLAADLPVYVRQSHAEHDLAAIGVRVKQDAPGTWTL